MTFYLQTLPYNRPVRRLRRFGPQSLRINIREEEDAYIVTALVPGLKAEDLNIQVLDNVVRIAGEYSQDENPYLMRELPSGTFTRTLEMPSALEPDSVDANITDGILTLPLPKAQSARPKQIKIKSK